MCWRGSGRTARGANDPQARMARSLIVAAHSVWSLLAGGGRDGRREIRIQRVLSVAAPTVPPALDSHPAADIAGREIGRPSLESLFVFNDKFKVLLRGILPNCLSPIVHQATFTSTSLVLAEASSNFIGAGSPAHPEVGRHLDLRERRIYIQNPPDRDLPGLGHHPNRDDFKVSGLNLAGTDARHHQPLA